MRGRDASQEAGGGPTSSKANRICSPGVGPFSLYVIMIHTAGGRSPLWGKIPLPGEGLYRGSSFFAGYQCTTWVMDLLGTSLMALPPKGQE